MKYEQKAHRYLNGRYGVEYIPSPWFTFREQADDRTRWCQPDGILLCPTRGVLTIIEVKYQHTSDAWWQVVRLYLPVLQALFPPKLWSYRMCELVKWYDPATAFPQAIRLTPDPSRLKDGDFGVHIWKP
jgi:hypothetical protein